MFSVILFLFILFIIDRNLYTILRFTQNLKLYITEIVVSSESGEILVTSEPKRYVFIVNLYPAVSIRLWCFTQIIQFVWFTARMKSFGRTRVLCNSFLMQAALLRCRSELLYFLRDQLYATICILRTRAYTPRVICIISLKRIRRTRSCAFGGNNDRKYEQRPKNDHCR